VDVDLRETARAIGSSVPALKAALRRLRRSGLAEQKRPRSSLWRLSADAAWLLQAEPPARERGKEVAAAGSAAREG
jgi:predicted transcriptional regulator